MDSVEQFKEIQRIIEYRGQSKNIKKRKKKEYHLKIRAEKYRKNLIKNATKCELILKERLIIEGIKFTFQYPVIVNDSKLYICDFLIKGKDPFIVEVDGNSHDHMTRQLKDHYRTQDLNEYGFDVIRFKNSEIFNSLDSVVDRIKATI